MPGGEKRPRREPTPCIFNDPKFPSLRNCEKVDVCCLSHMVWCFGMVASVDYGLIFHLLSCSFPNDDLVAQRGEEAC